MNSSLISQTDVSEEYYLTNEELKNIDSYWRAANYLSVGQIYLLDNPLLKEPLTLQHVKRRFLGHWGTTPGLNFIYAMEAEPENFDEGKICAFLFKETLHSEIQRIQLIFKQKA